MSQEPKADAVAPGLTEQQPAEQQLADPQHPGERRPDQALLQYYFVESMILLPFFFLWLLPRYFRYRSLRYRFDDEGVTMRWGVLFRREISLTFGRIQDIHLESNFVERHLGLARIKVQTAAGSAQAEMTIEGLPDFEAVRDYLYSRMRGVRGAAKREAAPTPSAAATLPHASGAVADAEIVAALRETAEALRALREELGRRGTVA